MFYTCSIHDVYMTYVKKIPISKNKVLQKGPLESVFPGSTSKILDFLATFKDWDYSVSDIAKNSGVSFKTALNEIKNLEQQGVVSRKRTVGKDYNVQTKLGFKTRVLH